MMYLWPPFTPSILTPTLIQHSRHSVCLECRPLSFSCCLSFIIGSISLLLYLSLSIYLSLYLSFSAVIESPPPPSPRLQPPPCCLLPSAVSEFPRVRQRETITLRRIRSPPISPCLLLPGSLCLSSSPSSSTFLFPLPQRAALFLFLFFASTRIRFSLREPVHACTGHLVLFPSSSASRHSPQPPPPPIASPSLPFVSQYNWHRRSAPCRVCLNAKCENRGSAQEQTGEGEERDVDKGRKEEKKRQKGRAREQTA